MQHGNTFGNIAFSLKPRPASPLEKEKFMSLNLLVKSRIVSKLTLY